MSRLCRGNIQRFRKKVESKYKKVVVKPNLFKNQIIRQLAYFDAKQVKHENIEIKHLDEKINILLNNYRQVLIRTKDNEWHILKMGQKFKAKKIEKENTQTIEHNRQKEYILNEGENLPFLVAQGVMSSNFKVKANMQHKFRQINRYLEFVRDIIDLLPKDRPIHIVDFGCGKSYLTFALYHYLHEILHLDVVIHGLDLKKEVIEDCNQLSNQLGFNNLKFSYGDIAQYKGDHEIDMIVTLHACDVATDYALYQAIKWNCKVIFSVPCCQHELNKTIENETLAPIFKYGVIKERIASLMTDGLRAAILDSLGYKTQILEFIDMEDTPKNLLIRACKVNKKKVTCSN